MKRMMTILAAACAALVALPAVAASPTERANAVQHMAVAAAISQLCPRLEVNQLLMAQVVTVMGIDMNPGAADRMSFERQAREQIAEMSDDETDLVCAAGVLSYGPSGIGVKNFLTGE